MIYYVLSCFIVLLFVFIFLYVRFLLMNMKNMSDDIAKIGEVLDNFHTHMEKVYNSEIFYGDETLENFLKHTKEVNEEIKDFNQTYDLFSNEGEVLYDEEEDSSIKG